MAAKHGDFRMKIRPGTKLDSFAVKRPKELRGCFPAPDCSVGRIADENVVFLESDTAISGHVGNGNKAPSRDFRIRPRLLPYVASYDRVHFPLSPNIRLHARWLFAVAVQAVVMRQFFVLSLETTKKVVHPLRQRAFRASPPSGAVGSLQHKDLEYRPYP